MHANNTLVGLILPADYIATRQNVFPNGSSLKWFMRRYRAKIREANAVSRPLGRDLIDEEKFDSIVLEVGRAALVPVGAE